MKVIAIDPAGCGCTECLTGQYVPLDLATREQVLKMLRGKLRNHTGESFTITSEYSGRSWTVPS
jgi:hypothetical protein